MTTIATEATASKSAPAHEITFVTDTTESLQDTTTRATTKTTEVTTTTAAGTTPKNLIMFKTTTTESSQSVSEMGTTVATKATPTVPTTTHLVTLSASGISSPKATKAETTSRNTATLIIDGKEPD